MHMWYIACRGTLTVSNQAAMQACNFDLNALQKGASESYITASGQADYQIKGAPVRRILKSLNLRPKALHKPLDKLLDEQHCYQEAKQLATEAREAGDVATRAHKCKDKQQDGCPHIDPGCPNKEHVKRKLPLHASINATESAKDEGRYLYWQQNSEFQEILQSPITAETALVMCRCFAASRDHVAISSRACAARLTCSHNA